MWLLEVEVFTEVQGDGPVQSMVEVTLVGTTVSSSMNVTLSPDSSKVKFNISIPEVCMLVFTVVDAIVTVFEIV